MDDPLGVFLGFDLWRMLTSFEAYSVRNLQIKKAMGFMHEFCKLGLFNIRST